MIIESEVSLVARVSSEEREKVEEPVVMIANRETSLLNDSASDEGRFKRAT